MTNKILKCGLLEYDPVGELAVYNGQTIYFRENTREAIVLKLLLENKNHRVFYRTLILQSISDPKKLVALNDNRVWKKEKLSIQQAVKVIKNKLDLPKNMIRCVGKRGYKIIDKR